MNIGNNVHIADGIQIPDDAEIGDYSKIYDGTVLAPKTKIGHSTVIGKLVNFEAGATIGNHVKIYSQSHLTTGILVEDFAWIGPMFLGLNTKRIRHLRDFPLEITPPIIRRGARIGARVTIMPGIEIGEEALIDACAIVTKDVPAREIWRGGPAQKIGDVPDDEITDYAAVISVCDLCVGDSD